MERMTPEQLSSLYSSNRNLFLELANKWYAEDPEYYKNFVNPILNSPTPQTQSKPKKKTWLIIALCIVGGLIFMCSLFKFFPQKTESVQPDVSIDKPKEYITVQAIDLFSDYQKNEVAADNDYKGKLFIIRGGITKIDKDFLNNIIINLKTTNEFIPVRCYLKDTMEKQAAQLRIGEMVSLLGKGDGSILGSPLVKNCEIVR